MTNLKTTRNPTTLGTTLGTTRRGFVKGSLATGFAAGIAVIGSGVASAFPSLPANQGGGRSIGGRVDQPLNQINPFDSAENLTTAWAGQFEKTGQLSL